MAFEVTLNKRAPEAKLWRSDDQTEGAKQLQSLFDKGMSDEYDAAKKEMEKDGKRLFRKTNNHVFELFGSNKTMRVPIKFQVKLGTINWYFMAPKDETHQSFRDELYNAAGIAHMSKVENHCQAYWRGTNSFHLKKMHSDEEEDNYNHNHYRVENDRDVDPTHVSQHLLGLVESQREMGLVGEDGKEKFVTLQDALEISHKFNIHWVKINHAGAQKEVKVGDEFVSLPERDVSILSQFKEARENKLTEEDLKEWTDNRHKEEPCREMTITKEMPLTKKIELAAKGSRGIGSDLAETRQLEWSTRAVNKTVVSKDDKLPQKGTVATTTQVQNQVS